MDFDVAFVLTKQARLPDRAAYIARAAELGLTISAAAAAATDSPTDSATGALPTTAADVQAYEIAGGGQVLLRAIAERHGEAADLPAGPTSPSPEDLKLLATEHFVIAVRGLPEAARARDLSMSIIIAAVLPQTEAIGVIMHPVASVHRAELFAELVAIGAAAHEVAPHLMLGVAGGVEEEDRLGLLTFGMRRYGREELLITAPLAGEGAIGFLYDVAEWILGDPAPSLDDGDQLTRNEMTLTVRRVPHPAGGETPHVIRLDLPA